MKKKEPNTKHLGSVFVKEDGQFVHTYELEHSESGVTSIHYSIGEVWTEMVQGVEAGSVYDNGNEVAIQIEGKSIRLDYAQMEVLTALLMSCNESEMELRKYHIISSIKPIV